MTTTSQPHRPPVIALVGIDGSGKTTQAHRLTEWLNRRGVRARYWQNAGGRRWLSRLAQRWGRPDALTLVGPRGLLLIESVLRWLAIARALTWSRLTGQVAVMDRYAICQYVSIRAHGGGSGHLARAWYRWFPEPDVTFILTVPAAEAYRRINLRATDHERPEFLAAAAAAYQDLLARWDGERFVRIDADTTPDQVFHEVTAHLVGSELAADSPC